MKKIIKGAIVLIVALVLISTSFVATSKTNEKTQYVLDPSHIKNTNPNPSVYENTASLSGPIIFSQLPFLPEEDWVFYTSSSDAGYLTMDNYGVDEDVCDIHWWGLSLVYPWAPCDPTGMVFEIIFWDTSGNPVCVYQVTPPAQPTGLFYSGFEMYYWEADLYPCCPLENGWISIQSISSANGCWFMWAGSDDGDLLCYQNDAAQTTDCAFELTAEEPEPIPAICCDPIGLYFGDDIPVGNTVTGQIYVCNCGDSGSYLDWYLDTASAPAWGTWTFTPASGTGLVEGACDIVDVTCLVNTAGTYSGNIYVYNADDPTDFCMLATGGTWPLFQSYNLPFVQWLQIKCPLVKVLLGL